MIQYILFFLFFIFSTTFLEAHHGTESSSMLAIDPVTGRQKPGDYIMATEELRKAAIGYRDEYISTIYAEKKFAEGKFSATLLANYYYYDQKEREHAGRIGKTFLGMRAAPITGKFEHFNIIFDGSIGFPSGNDTNRFIGGNYYSGIAGMTSVFTFKRYLISTRINGIFPIGKTTYIDPLTEKEVRLKKVSAAQIMAGYRITSKNILSVGYQAWGPYYGIEKIDLAEIGNSQSKKEPDHSIYREYLASISHTFSDELSAILYYKRPVYRNEFKPYEEAFSITLIAKFN